MTAVVVVKVQVGLEPSLAFGRAFVPEAVCPFTQERLDEPLNLSVRARRVRPGAFVGDLELGAKSLPCVGAKGRAVVGHHALDLDIYSREPGNGSIEEGARGLSVLTGQDLRVGEPRVIVGGNEDVLEALFARPVRALACDAMTDFVDASEALGVDVK